MNAGTVSSLRLRGNTRPCYNVDRDRRQPRRRLAPASVPRPGEARVVRARHARVREVHRRDRGRGHGTHVRALAIVDGEHYATVVRDALAELPYDFVAAVLVGGEEKLRGGDEYGVPLVADVESAVASLAPDVVVDLSDEPVLGPVARFELASRVLALGLPYVGADFRLDPPARAPFDLPSIAVIGTGKRVGKTAVTGPPRASACQGAARRRRCDGPRRAGGARARHRPADSRRARRALAQRPSRRVRSPGDGCARRCRDGGLQAVRRRARRWSRHLQRRRRRPHRDEPCARPRRLRRQRCRVAADRRRNTRSPSSEAARIRSS